MRVYVLNTTLFRSGVKDIYASTHRANNPERCLHKAERGEKRMYLEACLQQRRHFSPFVASLYVLLRVEATATLKRLASRLATKWKQSYSKTCGTDSVHDMRVVNTDASTNRTKDP